MWTLVSRLDTRGVFLFSHIKHILLWTFTRKIRARAGGVQPTRFGYTYYEVSIRDAPKVTMNRTHEFRLYQLNSDRLLKKELFHVKMQYIQSTDFIFIFERSYKHFWRWYWCSCVEFLVTFCASMSLAMGIYLT